MMTVTKPCGGRVGDCSLLIISVSRIGKTGWLLGKENDISGPDSWYLPEVIYDNRYIFSGHKSLFINDSKTFYDLFGDWSDNIFFMND